MSNIIPFKFKDSEIRTVQLEDEPLFIAKDVAQILGYSNVNDAIKRHCEGVVKHDLPTASGIQSMSLIPEFDVYALILRSKLSEAKKFKQWVCKEVLPSIRKTGSFQSNPQNVPQSFAESLRLAADLAERLEEAKPKIAFAEAVNDSINCVTLQDFAKAVGTGQNRLFKLLRAKGYLQQRAGQQNKPYQQYVDQGLFKLVENTFKNKKSGEVEIYFRTVITPKGQLYFQNKYFNSKVA